MNTLSREYQSFITRLKSKPFFLLKHTKSLSLAVCKKIYNKLKIGLASRHRGRKAWPSWLKRKKNPISSCLALDQILRDLPCFFLNFPKLNLGSSDKSKMQNLPDDLENYFEQNRWGFLLDNLFNAPVDWNESLEKVDLWIENQPAKSDMAWEAYSTCERVANLLIFISVMPLDLRQKKVSLKVCQFISDSLNWLYQHIEYYGPILTNNHILNNARALVMAGLSVGNDITFDAGMKIFREFLPQLVMREGFLRERSSHYQLIVLSWLLDAWKFTVTYRGQEDANAEFLRNYVERMTIAAALLCYGRAHLLSTIGDISPDITPAQSIARLMYLYPEVWCKSDVMLVPLKISDDWFKISSGKEIILGNFPQGKYPPHFPTHGHCDMTSFVWIHENVDILTDCGRFRYTPDDISLFQKSALGHNVPLVDGFAPVCETLVPNGAWWPVPYASAILKMTSCQNGVILEHNGFARSTPVKNHSRTITTAENIARVVDCFSGEGEVNVSFCWHFGEEFKSFDQKRSVVIGNYGEIKLNVEGVTELPKVEFISEKSPGSWKSSIYGEVQPVLGICLSWCVKLPVEISTQFELTLCAE